MLLFLKQCFKIFLTDSSIYNFSLLISISVVPMKVLITYPPIESAKGFPLLSQNRQFQYFHNPSLIYPLIPASAATLLKARGFEVAWKDAIAERMTFQAYLDYFSKEKPDLAAMETKTPVVKRHWEIIRRLKAASPQTRFLLMGDHVTAKPDESLENCPELDFVLTGGDFDFLLLELCNSLKKGTALPKGIWYRENSRIKNTGPFELSHSLDELPIIDRELTKCRLYNIEYNIKARPFAYTMAGRDCPWGRCAFCAWPQMFPKFRTRSPEKLLDEIGVLIEKYGVKEVFDDTGTFPPGKWREDFCNGMIERGYNRKIRFSCNDRVDFIKPEMAKLMRKAGFRLLKMGLESGNQETLDRLNKGITVEQIVSACETAKKNGLEIHLTMIIGYPWETRAMAMKTFELAKHLMTTGKADVLQSTVLIPYPGTRLYEEAIEKGWLRFDPEDYERFDMSEPVLKTPDMSPEQVMEICSMVYKIFLTPRYVLKHVKRIRSFRDLKYTAGGVKAVLGHMKDFGRKV